RLCGGIAPGAGVRSPEANLAAVVRRPARRALDLRRPGHRLRRRWPERVLRPAGTAGAGRAPAADGPVPADAARAGLLGQAGRQLWRTVVRGGDVLRPAVGHAALAGPGATRRPGREHRPVVDPAREPGG